MGRLPVLQQVIMLRTRVTGGLRLNTSVPSRSTVLRVVARFKHEARVMAYDSPNVDNAADYLTRAEAPQLPWLVTTDHAAQPFSWHKPHTR